MGIPFTLPMGFLFTVTRVRIPTIPGAPAPRSPPASTLRPILYEQIGLTTLLDTDLQRHRPKSLKFSLQRLHIERGQVTKTALKNRVYAFLAQQREKVRKTNIFSEKGQKALLGLDLAPRETIIGNKWEDIFRWEENGHAYPIFGFSSLCIQGDSLP